MNTSIIQQIKCIKPIDELEQATIDDALAWIGSGVEICRIEKPAVPPKHLISYFVLIDGDYILLVDHINAQLWLPTGGHVEPGEHPKTTAIREAEEELGIVANFLNDDPIFITLTETVGKTAGHIDVSLWYILSGDRSAELVYDQSEFNRVRWFHKDEIPMSRTDQHMARFLNKL